ncbi:MAG: nucleolar RNA-binding Nop10p family protein [Candidatus Nanohaloarchaea archaeon]
MIRRKPDGSFTLAEKTEGEENEPVRPPKFSFPDRYGEYRRKTKKESGRFN